MANEKTVRVGNAGGYWGDDLDAFQRQLSMGPLDYLSLDFLAEITMSILQKQRARNPDMGYARDFVDQVQRALPYLSEGKTRVISNAGGINPRGCARRIAEVAREAHVKLPIAVVEGDDLMDRLDELIQDGHKLANMETGQELASIRDKVQSANAYLGAAPVIKALEMGGQIIVTGRVTDTGITIAAPAFEFGWDLDDWDRLASAVIAGHIIECGAQASGGNLTDWHEVESFQRMGYPIVEVSSDGSFIVTKHEKAGGLVNEKTVSEQLVYEMGDPWEYITPDVVAEFSSIRLQDLGDDRVRISGVRGRRRTESLKASISYHDGYKAQGTVIVSRPDAVEKCRAIEEIFFRRLGLDFEETRANLVGYNACHQHLVEEHDPPEILLQIGVRDGDKGKVAEFSKQFPSVILSTVPGVAIVGARPRIQDVVAYWPCLLPADEVTPRVSLLDGEESVSVGWTAPPVDDTAPDAPSPPGEEIPQAPQGPRQRMRLRHLAYARSGDKGNTCNIGVVARSRPIYAFLQRELTAAKVKEFFGDICQGQVERFEVPNIKALNFLLHESLGGGGTLSLGIDPQGKTYAHALLLMEIEAPRVLLDSLR
ncbi:MAG TPA: acyclic terpene utilization AtuA family protein [Acidobacteriota bacterium]|nr:acyclic terpene utilization AtuA family protein [Acidobacteriota bacterium]